MCAAIRPSPSAEEIRGTVMAMVLGGGPSDYDKLYPLTVKRALPAVPVGGVYRLIDIPLSSLIASNINKVYVVTQFLSHSLNKYLHNTYRVGGGAAYGGSGFIEVLTSTQSPTSTQFARGTADAVRQFMWTIDDQRNQGVEDVIILPADHLYRTDFTGAIAAHRRAHADVTILCVPVGEDGSDELGLAQVDCDDDVCTITRFSEKPKGEAKAAMRMDPSDLQRFRVVSGRVATVTAGVRNSNTTAQYGARAVTQKPEEVNGAAQPGVTKDDPPTSAATNGAAGAQYLGSTGIYIFRRDVLCKLLREHPDATYFGREMMPIIIEAGELNVQAVELQGSWRDVGGSIKAFYDANMDMLKADVMNPHVSPELSKEELQRVKQEAAFFDPAVHKNRLFQAPINAPPVEWQGSAHVTSSYIAPGTRIGNKARVIGSSIGVRAVLGPDTLIEDSVIMGADYYEEDIRHRGGEQPVKTGPALGIGEGSVIKKAIVDKNARIGKNVQLINKEGAYESRDYASIGVHIRNGIIVVQKSAIVPDNTVI